MSATANGRPWSGLCESVLYVWSPGHPNVHTTLSATLDDPWDGSMYGCTHRCTSIHQYITEMQRPSDTRPYT